MSPNESGSSCYRPARLKSWRGQAADEEMVRVAHEGRVQPLRAALAQAEAELEDAGMRESARVLLLERLQTAEAQRAAQAEKAEAADRRASAAELREMHAAERLELVRTELGRREARMTAMRTTLGACEEELSLLRASKELLAARHELQAELSRQRSAVQQEESAVQGAVASVKARQLEATDALVRAVGQHAVEAVSAARDAQAQAQANEQQAEAQWEERFGKRGHEHAQSEVAVSELHGRLQAARVEVEACNARSDQLNELLQQAKSAAEERARELGETRDQSFHNHVLLVKLLLNTRQRPQNVLVQELYEELDAKAVPVAEWPKWVMARMGDGASLSQWL